MSLVILHIYCTLYESVILTLLRLMLTGLHTCGNLAASVLQLFVNNPLPVRVLCNVGCCYHLLEEEFVRNPFLEDGMDRYRFLNQSFS